MSKNETLNIFTYDYPSLGGESIFIKDEIKFLSNKFKKINIIPLKNRQHKLRNVKKNIYINYGLINEIYDVKKILSKFIKILICKLFWAELISLKRKNIFSKIIMTVKERYLAESVYLWVKNNKNLHNGYFYSIWSNHTLLGFYLLKQKKIIKKSFARILGSDLKGFIPRNEYISFRKFKFKTLDLVLTLNNEQKDILVQKKLIKTENIKKNYLGINGSKSKKTNKLNKKRLIFASCGRFIHAKNTIEILNFIKIFAKNNKHLNIDYYCIGDGYQKEKILDFARYEFPENIKFKFINYVPSLVKFLKEKKINYFLNFSFSEGMSFAIMEALSCSLPIICSDIPGNNEIINKRNGYLIKSFNEKEYLSISKKIMVDIKNNRYQNKQKESLKTTLEKINRLKCLASLNKIINKNILLK